MQQAKPTMVLHSYVDAKSQIELQLTNVGATAVSDFCLCFSLLAPATAISNCKITDQVGGYTRLEPTHKLPIEPGSSWTCQIAYREKGSLLNVAWGPKGAYITHRGLTTEVQTQPSRFGDEIKPKEPSLSIDHQQLKLSPKPTSWAPNDKYCDCNTGFNTTDSNLDIAKTAWLDASALGLRSGLMGTHEGHMPIMCTINMELNQEAYHLHIETDSVSLVASHEQGFFYGFISLLQMYFSYQGRLPCGLMKDQPRFKWRGQHLDCARQFFNVTTICQLIDVMALLKLNRFHWHAVDDEAFRFELECAPKLAEKTAWRGEDQLIPAVFGGGIGPTGGSYSKADVGEILQHAHSCHLQVMAEIDLPGHCLALVSALPELSEELSNCSDSKPESVQGYHNNTINPSLDCSWQILKPIIVELCDLFGSDYLHLGGDEVAPECWDGSPAIEQLKQTYGLTKDIDILGWFMAQAAAIVRQQGILPAAWQESADSTLYNIGNDALVFAWQNAESGKALAKRGFQVVMTPAQHLYFDMACDSSPQSSGATWAGHISLEDTTNWHVANNIAGVQGALWCETINTPQELKRALAPRIIGLAESAWCTDKNTRRGRDLVQAAHDFNPIWQALGWPTQPF
jgi:hexosaminidase